jgi:Domain of unknown function (DUF5753)
MRVILVSDTHLSPAAPQAEAYPSSLRASGALLRFGDLVSDHPHVNAALTGQPPAWCSLQGTARDLLAEYGVDEAEQRVLAAIADPRATRGWWQDYADVLPQAFRDYLIIEAAASQVLIYDNQRVPGLLQTEEYAHAIVSADPAVPPGLQERLVEAWLSGSRPSWPGSS